ncbi:glycosyltransferase [Ectobacillus panaciterrae]|uniref:glycosyltransferase n=1 Tax=Ectobacillus panaciterrae TaxID=363872 RepID=UPI0003FB0978|nr:glycosyltransferase [Ectobacillus panaciterrae]
MKILHVSEALDKGGLEEVIYNLVKHTNDADFHVQAASFKSGEVSSRMERNGFAYHDLSAPMKQDRIQKLTDLIKREGFDLVQAHFCFEAIAAAKACGVKVIETVHNTYGFFVNPWGKLKYSYYLNRADAVVAVSDAVKEFNEKHFFLFNKSKQIAIRNSINPERLVPSFRSREEIKKELGIPVNSTVISTLSRLDVQKGLEYFIDTARKLNEQFDNLVFLIPGEGEADYAKHLKEYAKDAANVYFLGHVSQVSDLFAIMDIFVMSSLWEGAPLTLLEAMAHEKPSVVTRVGNTAEVIQDGQNGYLVDAKDTNALTERIKRLLEDEKERQELARQAKEDFYAKFSNDVMIDRYKDLYRELIK